MPARKVPAMVLGGSGDSGMPRQELQVSQRRPKMWCGSPLLRVLHLGPQREDEEVTADDTEPLSDAQWEGEWGRKASSRPPAYAPGTQSDMIHVTTPGLPLPRAHRETEAGGWGMSRHPPECFGGTRGGCVLREGLHRPIYYFFFSSWVFFFCSLGDISGVPSPAPGTRCP